MRLQVIGLGECEYGRNQNPLGAGSTGSAESMGFERVGGVDAGGGSCLEKAGDRHCESDSAGAMETQRCSDAAGGTVFGLGGGWLGCRPHESAQGSRQGPSAVLAHDA